MTRVSVDTTGAKRKFERARKAFEPRTLMRAIGERTVVWINRNFETSGGLVGGWKPLAAGGRSGKPLQDKGKLKRSFRILRLNQSSVTVGSTVPYASAHEDGVPASAINPIVPRRASVLRFVISGNVVFARIVRNHPGIPRRRMLPNKREQRELAVNFINSVVAKIDKGK